MEESKTYISAEELGRRLNYNPRYIRQYLVDDVLEEGVHFFRPFGRRKLLFVWETIERDMLMSSIARDNGIPLARGGVCNG